MLEHYHSRTDDEARCDECGGHVYEVSIRGRWFAVSAYIFRSWTGGRRIDGENYNGPIYILGTGEVHNV